MKEGSPYNYVRGNPLGLIDPNGMSDETPEQKAERERKEAEEKAKLLAEQAAKVEKVTSSIEEAKENVSTTLAEIGEAITDPLKTFDKIIGFFGDLIPGAKDGAAGKTASGLNKASRVIGQAPNLINQTSDATNGQVTGFNRNQIFNNPSLTFVQGVNMAADQLGKNGYDSALVTSRFGYKLKESGDTTIIILFKK